MFEKFFFHNIQVSLHMAASGFSEMLVTT